MKKYIKFWAIQLGITLLPAIYLGGVLGQFLYNNQHLNDGLFKDPVFNIGGVFNFIFTNTYGIMGILIAWFAINAGLGYLKNRFGNSANMDAERNFEYSEKGTYGTSGWMTDKEREKILNIADKKTTTEVILGRIGDKVITIPDNTDMNKHIAVYGASGTGKSRAFARTYMLQAAKRGESMIVTDPKGELFQSMSPYLRSQGYDVKVLNLVALEHSDAWNCLAEIGGDDLKAQVFSDVIIQNTQGKSGSDFWSQCEMNLLKALCLYVERSPALPHNMSEVYNLISTKSPIELDMLFDELPYNDETQAAKAAYNIFKQAGDNVKGGVVIGLGSRLQVFQGSLVRKITSYKEIELVKPAYEKCAYFCITSDQHSAFDFLAVLFYSMLFIKLVEYADTHGIKGRCPVPVNFVLDEFPNIGAIPDFTKKISTVRSRGINIAVIFQNIAQLQNRYPYGQWEEILGNCDTHLFLGCTDATTAKFVSERTGVVTVGVSSKSKDKRIGSLLEAKDYKENSSVGKRNLLTADEVLRLPPDKELILLRGQKPLKAHKFDYTAHPESNSLVDARVADYTPEWKKNEGSFIQKEKEKEKKGTIQEAYEAESELPIENKEIKKKELRDAVIPIGRKKPKNFN